MAPRIPKRVTEVLALGTARKVMRVCVVFSLLCHVAILLAIQKAFPINWVLKPLKTYRVELLRPPVDPLEEKDDAGTGVAQEGPQKKTAAKKGEDTIALDTKDKRYSSYAKMIKDRLMRHWKYPAEALENLMEGDLLVIFTLDRSGGLNRVRVVRSSDYGILNDEAVRAIRAASPFPPFPESVEVARLNVKARFDYRLTSSN